MEPTSRRNTEASCLQLRLRMHKDNYSHLPLPLLALRTITTGNGSLGTYMHSSKTTFPPSSLRLTISLSDRQKGLLEGVGIWFPGSAHGYCLRHLVDNFSKHFKHKDFPKLLWQAARAMTEAEFKTSCNAMRVINVKCVDWLLNNAHPRHWAMVYFPGRRCGHFTSNISESLNSWLLRARDLPVEAMLEAI
jgi:hypothetical protein